MECQKLPSLFGSSFLAALGLLGYYVLLIIIMKGNIIMKWTEKKIYTCTQWSFYYQLYRKASLHVSRSFIIEYRFYNSDPLNTTRNNKKSLINKTFSKYLFAVALKYYECKCIFFDESNNYITILWWRLIL